MTKREEKFEDMIDTACYGAIISLEGEMGTKAEIKRYAYEVEIMENTRNGFTNANRFYGKKKLQEAISEYIDEWYADVADDDEVFEIHQ